MTIIAFMAFALASCSKKAEAQASKTSAGGTAKVKGEVAPESDFEIEFIDDNENAVEITWYNGNAKTLIIPSTIQGYPVVRITLNYRGEWREREALETLVIPEGVVSIGKPKGTFSNLKIVVFPESLKFISRYAFEYAGIESIAFPKGLQIIGDSAFQNCKNLTNIDFSSATNLKVIGDSAFSGTAIKEVVLPESLKYIGEFAFSCENLSLDLITLPSEPDKVFALFEKDKYSDYSSSWADVFFTYKFSDVSDITDLRLRKELAEKWEIYKNLKLTPMPEYLAERYSDWEKQLKSDFPDLNISLYDGIGTWSGDINTGTISYYDDTICRFRSGRN